MTDILIIGDTIRSPELRHEVPLPVPDPFVYLERDGGRHVFIGSMEVARVRSLGLDIEVHPAEEIGVDELYGRGLSGQEFRLELVSRACAHVGLVQAVVPHTFPAGHLARLGSDGLELTVDQSPFDARRRTKSSAELAGIRRAQLAAEAGMATGVSLLRAAENGDGVLWLDGEPLTVERIKAAIRQVFAAHCATAEDFVVAPGPQAASGHDMGSGPIRFGETIVFDLWPRDDASSCFADMTRTFVVGPVSEEAASWHRVTLAALEATTAVVRAGVDCRAVFDVACDVIEAEGYPTQRTKTQGEALAHGFFHGLGHGVGLDVHEAPSLGRLPDGVLLAGDVITLEPGVYDPAVGGVRLEDLLLVTEDGCEVLTRFPYEMEISAA